MLICRIGSRSHFRKNPSTTTGIIKDPPKPVTGKCERPVGEGNGKRGPVENVPGDSKPAANALPSGGMPWEEKPRDEKQKKKKKKKRRRRRKQNLQHKTRSRGRIIVEELQLVA